MAQKPNANVVLMLPAIFNHFKKHNILFVQFKNKERNSAEKRINAFSCLKKYTYIFAMSFEDK